MKKYVLMCTCGLGTDCRTWLFQSAFLAMTAAEMHALLGERHQVTCINDENQKQVFVHTVNNPGILNMEAL